MRVVCMCILHHMNACSPCRSDQNIRFPETGGTEYCELPYEFRESKLGPLGKQQVLLTPMPPLRPQNA